MLHDLFPAPAPSRSKLSPRAWPGITPQSTETIKGIIKDSQERWHVFLERSYRPHNHAVHFTLALWALGADDEIIKAAYRYCCAYSLPRFESPGKITEKNFNEHLGDDEYYSAYLDFFTDAVTTRGVSGALEEYVFSQKRNFIPGKKDEEQPEMLDRCMDGILHSIIHIGYGVEFGVPGLVAEGLAWAAVHYKSSPTVIPSSLWQAAGADIETGPLQTPHDNGAFIRNTAARNGSSQDANIHAFTILARILKDSRFDAIPAAEHYAVVYSNAADKYGDIISEYARSWTFDNRNPQEVERKIEELVYAYVLIYGVGGWSKDRKFNTDFYNVHLVTSALLVSSICNVLKPASQELLLRGYFAVCLTWWIARGRPGFDIESFYTGTSINPGPVISVPPPHKNAFPNPDSPLATRPNPWFQLIQDALVVPEEHFPKAIRALAHFAEIYGGRKAGQNDFVATELPGTELIDGTLFVRVALVNNSKLREEKDLDLTMAAYWDRQGFYAEPLPESISGIPSDVINLLRPKMKK